MKLTEIRYETRMPDDDEAGPYDVKQMRQTTQQQSLRKTLDDLRSRHSHKQPGDKLKFKGAGAFATAYELPKKVNTVVKVGDTYDPNRDGYLLYVKTLEAHKGKHNPYFPQIYNVTITRTEKTGGIGQYPLLTYKVMMEKLQPLGEAGEDELKAYLLREFKLDDAGIKKMMGYYGIKYYGSASVAILLVYIFDSLVNQTGAEVDLLMDHASSELKEAIELLRSMLERFPVGTDFGMNNIMIRRSRYGIQPVFSDPLS